MKIRTVILAIILLAGVLTIGPVRQAMAQGTIYGLVHNADFSVPENGQIKFIGYLDDTDEEIRIESSIGAGYDNGNWYDDFQNYLTEAPGNPYDFHFFNTSNGEGFILSGPIPSNSYYQEDIQLEINGWPAAPAGLQGSLEPDSTVRLTWDFQSGLSYRVYRRTATSQGSFFRLDDPSGSPANPGLTDSVFIDDTVEDSSDYDYMIIPLDNGIIGLHSDYITVDVYFVGDFLCGDVDGSGFINVLDLTFLIRYLYQGGPLPNPPQSGDVNSSGGINLLDITYLLRYIYQGDAEPNCPDSW